MNIQDLKSNTTWQEASNTINNNNNKISLAIATLENAKLKNKGYFTTVEKLNEAVPNPTIGSKAYVGTSEPYAIYIVENGVWVDSGYTGGDELVAKITTDRIEDGAVTTEKISASAFDSTLSVSGKIAPADVVGEKITELDAQINGDSEDYEVITPNEIADHYINKSGVYSTWEGIYSMTEPITLASGESIKIEGAGIAQVAAIAKVDGGVYTPLEVYEGTATAMQTKEYTATENINVVLSFRTTNSIWSHTIYKKSVGAVGIVAQVADIDLRVQTLEAFSVKTNIISVGVGKDFSNLNDAIASITNSSMLNQYRIEVYEGEYETVDASKIVSGYKGLRIPNFVSVVGVGDRNRIVIKGTLPSGYESFANTISTINMMLNGNIENVTIEATNLRYCNHDDGVNTIDVKQVYKDVKFVYNTTSVSGVAATCVGIGNEGHKDIVFDNCLFVNPNTSRHGILMHDNAAASQIEGGRIEVKNCIFKLGTAGYDIILSNSGGRHECYAILTSNSFTTGLVVTSSSASITTNRWKVIAQGNRNYSLTKKQGMVDVDLTDDVISW